MKKGLHYSPELEEAILAACMIEKSSTGRVYGTLEPRYFYSDDHQKIFQSLVEMYDQSIPIDLITLEHYMMRKGIELVNQNQYGNYAAYLCKITNCLVSTVHLEYHSFILKEMWKLRELERLTNSGFDPLENTSKQISELNDQLNEIRGSEFKQEWFSMTDLMVKLVQHQEEIKSGNKKFITTGFKKIDKLNGGFYGGQFIVIGARPSVGKSALMNVMARSMARQGKTVGVISLEMDDVTIAARLASLDSGMDFQTIYRNLFQDSNETQRFYNAISKTADLSIYVSDKTKVDVNEIRSKATKLINSKGCDCLMVDYLQLVESASEQKRNSNREQEVSKISRGLKLSAMEFNIPVIALCQLSREVTKRSAKDRYPKPSDLRESGSLEQDADAILMLHRDWEMGYEENENGQSTEFDADLLGVKWRNGAKFHLELEWVPAQMKFKEKPQMKGYIPIADVFDPTEPGRKEINE